MKKILFSAVALLVTTAPALAHHPLAGQPMETFSQGLLSGIGHPLLGFDHLFFVIAVGVAALYTGFARTAPAAYIVYCAFWPCAFNGSRTSNLCSLWFVPWFSIWRFYSRTRSCNRWFSSSWLPSLSFFKYRSFKRGMDFCSCLFFYAC